MKLYLSPAPHIRHRDSTASIMRDMLVALLPATVVAVWYFGDNAAFTVALGVASAVLFEFLYQKLTHKAVRVMDFSAAVTGLLLAVNLPASAPWWLPVAGSFLAIVLVKQLFGGIGDNFVNPALAARAILMASWPARMNVYTLPTYWSGADAVTAATPLAVADAVSAATPGAVIQDYSLSDLFFGNIPGTIGEVCKAAVLLGFLYLLARRVISWRIPVTLTAVFALCMWMFGADPLRSVLSGGIIFGAVFMATDYTTSPMSVAGQFVYAALCGLIIAIIRSFGTYPEGVTYGILIMNIVTPLLDKYIKPRLYGRAREVKADA
ncbi:MAG TPA: RnfABCDGE type electron transport complex subunit D [Clostridia bacterium]|nr:RnfABCDGE type electron transport complex subunit D [Clostridia bacterium]